tara:strand:- start:1707 stop:1925 length:219 start_codon:yes stop_codon:yes gene_type:complete
MKVGDLIRVPECPIFEMGSCTCVFCANNSSRIGVVTKKIPASGSEGGLGMANFDIGEWAISNDNAEVINESR